MREPKLIAGLAALLLCTLVAATAQAAQPDAEVAAVRSVVVNFHQALRQGDRKTALALLSPDVQVLEAGTVETRAQYEAAHLAADIEFSQTLRVTQTLPTVSIAGDVAWATSSATARGEFRKRLINTQGAELMVLSRGANGWHIRAIHWSSRPR